MHDKLTVNSFCRSETWSDAKKQYSSHANEHFAPAGPFIPRSSAIPFVPSLSGLAAQHETVEHHSFLPSQDDFTSGLVGFPSYHNKCVSTSGESTKSLGQHGSSIISSRAVSQHLHSALQRGTFLTLAQTDPEKEQNYKLPRVRLFIDFVLISIILVSLLVKDESFALLWLMHKVAQENIDITFSTFISGVESISLLGAT